VLTAFIATALANWLIYTWLPLFLYERFHLSLTGAGFSATFYIQAASYLGVVAGGILADRWSRTAPRARIYTQVAGMAVSAPFLALIGFANALPLVICSLVVFGLGRGFYDSNTMPVLRDVAGEGQSATGYGVFNAAGCIIGGVGVAIAGYLRQHLGLGAAFEIAAGVFVIGAATLLRIRVTAPDRFRTHAPV
jgi:MFS family permease